MDESKRSRDGPPASARFPLGRLLITPGAQAVLTNDEVLDTLARHARGDWGEGFRILSAYRSNAGVKFWIITEADRSVTTVLLPEEY